MINAILNSDIELAVSDAGKLSFKGPPEQVEQLMPALKLWKVELLKLLLGETVSDVGNCVLCDVPLIGIPVSFDGYTNRVCPDCGKWHHCLPPGWTLEDLSELIGERRAIMEHDGKLTRLDAISAGSEAVRVQLEEQKTIFESAERMYKGGRQPGRADDRDNH